MWIPFHGAGAIGIFEEDRDGMAHSGYTDHCDQYHREVVSAAIEASAFMFRAFSHLFNEKVTIPVSAPELQSVGLKWVLCSDNIESCTRQNGYCGSPWVEDARREPTKPVLACQEAPIGGGSRGAFIALWAFVAIVGAALALRRRPFCKGGTQ